MNKKIKSSETSQVPQLTIRWKKTEEEARKNGGIWHAHTKSEQYK